MKCYTAWDVWKLQESKNKQNNKQNKCYPLNIMHAAQNSKLNEANQNEE